MDGEGTKSIQQAIILILGFAVIWFLFWPHDHETLPAEAQQVWEEEYLVIEKLQIRAPIVRPQSRDEINLQQALQHGVAKLPDTAEFGQSGNAYVLGHSSDYRDSLGSYKTVFATLLELEAGDEIKIAAIGHDLVYTVIESRAVDAGDLSVLSQETAGQKILTLQTSYPIGTASKRWIVRAELSD